WVETAPPRRRKAGARAALRPGPASFATIAGATRSASPGLVTDRALGLDLRGGPLLLLAVALNGNRLHRAVVTGATVAGESGWRSRGQENGAQGEGQGKGRDLQHVGGP